jgi:hypothetical protein
MNMIDVIELAAKTAYEVNRAYSVGLGDTSFGPWTEAPAWQRTTNRKGVEAVIAGKGPRELHESWMEEKRTNGWKYGPVKNIEAKEHPCFVGYDDLPKAQRAKDTLFLMTVRGILDANGV